MPIKYTEITEMAKNFINYTRMQITYVLQLFRDEEKQNLKLSSTESSQQLSDNYPHNKLSFPLPITQYGLKTDADHERLGGKLAVLCVYKESGASHL